MDYSTTPEVATTPVGYVPYVAPTNSSNDNSPSHNEIMESHRASREAYSGAGTGTNTSTGVTNRAWGGRNMGGPIGLNAGGISVANTGLREDEIRQRQMMQSQIQPEQKSPLSGIGESLMMGAVDNGINTGLATLAGKEGLAGTLGTMMGSGGVGATAATGGLGAGMMAALGPVGIGLGLGKLFGVFNDGGKVPCSCGKTPCKCAKGKKSPLSGE